VHRFALEHWKDANRIQRLTPTFSVNRIIRQQCCASHVQPPELAANATASFIKVSRFFSCNQRCFRKPVHRFYLPGSFIAGFYNCAFADRLVVQIFDDLCCTFQWHKMVFVEVHHVRFDPLTILHRLTNARWKFTNCDAMALWAALDLRLMLSYFYFDWRNVKHLTFLVTLRFDFFQTRLTVLAALHPMHLHMLRICNRFECLARMSNLPTAFLATFLPQASRLLFQPIARWRFAAVATILGNLVFQLLHSFSQLANCSVEKLNNCFFALFVSSTDFFIAWQAEWFHAYILLGFYVFDNG